METLQRQEGLDVPDDQGLDLGSARHFLRGETRAALQQGLDAVAGELQRLQQLNAAGHRFTEEELAKVGQLHNLQLELEQKWGRTSN